MSGLRRKRNPSSSEYLIFIDSRFRQPYDAGMELSDASRNVLSAMHKRLPPLMSRYNRKRFINIIAMNGACICFERKDEVISPEDIYIGIYRFLGIWFQKNLVEKYQLSPEEVNSYKKKAKELDFTEIDTVMKTLNSISEQNAVPFSEKEFSPIMQCFKESFEYNPLYIKLALKENRPTEMYIRSGHPAKMVDYPAIAKEYGLKDYTKTKAALLLKSICRKARPNGTMMNMSMRGNIEKIYTFHAQKPAPISKITRCKNVPTSIKRNIPVLKKLGFTNFAICGVSFVKDSVNLYFHIKDRDELTKSRIEFIFNTLNFAVPEPFTMDLLQESAILHFTFTADNPEVSRVCFTYATDSSPERIYQLYPNLEPFLKTEIHSRKRNVFLGLAFGKEGHILKPEIEYKGTLNLPNFTSFSNLV